MAQRHRTIDAVGVGAPREASLRVHKIVFLVDVERLVVEAALVVVKLVVDAVGGVAHVAELNVGKNVEALGQVQGRFRESATVELVGVRVVIFIVAVGQILVGHGFIFDVVEVAEVVAIEILHRRAADNIQQIIGIVDVPNHAVGVLREALLAHKIGLFDAVALGVLGAQTVFFEFVVGAELLVVAVAVSVMQ